MLKILISDKLKFHTQMDKLVSLIGDFQLVEEIKPHVWLIDKSEELFILRFETLESCTMYFKFDSPHIQKIFAVYEVPEREELGLEATHAFLGKYYGPYNGSILRKNKPTEKQLLLFLNQIFTGFAALKDEGYTASDTGGTDDNILLEGYDEETGNFDNVIIIDINPVMYTDINESEIIKRIVWSTFRDTLLTKKEIRALPDMDENDDILEYLLAKYSESENLVYQNLINMFQCETFEDVISI